MKQTEPRVPPKQQSALPEVIRGYYTIASSLYKAAEETYVASLKKPANEHHFVFHLSQKGTKSDLLTSLKTLIEAS